jgi:hypothetical protein
MFSVAVSAQEAGKSGPRVLTATQLDQITAGTAGRTSSDDAGGTVVANGSSAEVTLGASVDLGDTSGQEARALNLGNAAGSVVSNAVNIWDGRLLEQTAATGLEVEQSNLVRQDGARAANIRDYARDSSLNETSSSTSNSTSAGSSTLVTDTMVDTRQTVGGGGLSLGGSSGNSDGDGGTGGGEQTGGNSLAVPEADVQVGKGLALGGTADISIGSADLSVGINAGASLSNSTRNLTVLDTGQISVAGASAQGPKATNDFTNDFELKGDVSVTFDLATPEIDFSVAGSGCFVMVGACAANANESSAWDDTASATSDATSQRRGALEVDSISAEYVVLDESSLTLDSQNTVSLSGAAQQGAQGLNILNAAGSLVSNAVNISRTPTVGPTLGLSQQNVVVQRR